MKGFTAAVLAALAALATSTLLSACASNSAQDSTAYADPGYIPTGSYIPRKKPTPADNVTQVDKQALENDRAMGSATINLRDK